MVPILKGLQQDSFETVEFVLTTIKQHVIDDSQLPRTLKISLFNAHILTLILNLCSRMGASALDWSNNQETNVSQVAYEFLLHISTQPGIGICYQDAGWYPAQKDSGKTIKINNIILSRFMEHLRPTEFALHKSLMIQIFNACPELVAV